MINDYQRLSQLQNYAMNSNGATEEQFGKTLDTVQTKLEKLKATVQTFTMTLANSEILGGIITALDKILEVVNILTGSLGKFGSSFANLGLVVGGLALGKKAISVGATTFSNRQARLEALRAGQSLNGIGPRGFFANWKEQNKTSPGLSGYLRNRFVPMKNLTKDNISKINEQVDIESSEKIAALEENLDKAKIEAGIKFDESEAGIRYDALVKKIETDKASLKAMKAKIGSRKKWKKDPNVRAKREEIEKEQIEADKLREQRNAAIQEDESVVNAQNELNNQKDLHKKGNAEAKINAQNDVQKAAQSQQRRARVSTALAVGGMALTGIGAGVSKYGQKNGSETQQKVGNALSTIGSFTAAGAMFGPWGALAGGIAGTAVAAAQAIDTPAEKAEKTMSRLGASLQEIKTASEKASVQANKFKEVSQNLDDSTKNTTEYNQALVDYNKQILDIAGASPNTYGARMGNDGQLILQKKDESGNFNDVEGVETELTDRAEGLEKSQTMAEAVREMSSYDALLAGAEFYRQDTKYDTETIKNAYEGRKANGIPIDKQLADSYATIIDVEDRKNSAIRNSFSSLVDSDTQKNENFGQVLGLVAENISSANQRDAIDAEVERLKKLDREDLKRQYAQATNQNILDITEETTNEQMADYLARQKVISGYKDNIEDNKSIWGADDKDTRMALAFLTGDLSNLTKEEAGGLKDYDLTDLQGNIKLSNKITEVAGALGMDFTLDQNSFNSKQEKYKDVDPMIQAQKKYQYLTGKGTLSEDFNTWRGAEAANVLSRFSNLASTSGFGRKKYSTQVANLLTNNAENGLMKALNSDTTGLLKQLFSDYNLTKKENWDTIIQKANSAGLSDDIINTLKKTESELIKLGVLVDGIRFENLIEEINKLNELSASIKSRSTSEGLTEDELKLSGLDSKDFIFNGKVYIPIKGDMSDISEAISEKAQFETRKTMAEKSTQLDTERTALAELAKRKVSSMDDEAFFAASNNVWTNKGITNIDKAKKFLNGEMSEDEVNEYKNTVDYYILNNKARSTGGVTASSMAGREYLYNYFADLGGFYSDNLDEYNKSLQMQYYNDPNAAYGTINDSNSSKQQRDIAKQAMMARYNASEDAQFLYSTLASREEGTLTSKKIEELKQFAVIAAEAVTKFNDLSTAISASVTNLKNLEKGTRDYDKELFNIVKNGQKIFGKKFTEKYVEENLKLFDALAEGGEAAEEAWDQIAKDTKPGNIIKAYENIYDAFVKLDSTQFTIGINYSLDELGLDTTAANTIQSVENKILAMKGAAKEQVDTAVAKLNDALPAGWEAVVNYSETAEGLVYPSSISYVQAGNSQSLAGQKSGGGGGGGGGKKKWKNPYDDFYNKTETLNQKIREREDLERQYDRLLKFRENSGLKLIENAQKQLDILQQEKKAQQAINDLAREKIANRLSGTYYDKDDNQKKFSESGLDLENYAQIDNETGQITLNIPALDALAAKDDSEADGKVVEEYIKYLEGLRDKLRESTDAIEEIEDSVYEIRQKGKEQYLTLYDRIKEALTKQRQDEIDELSKAYEKINDANSSLLSAISDKISELREARNTEKALDDLTEQQRRLALMQQDTSGANALEILALKEEIEDAQENYTDTLIDQKISALEKQNDLAANQRDRQIELLQEQLDWQDEHGYFNDQIDSLMEELASGVSDNIEKLLQDIEGYDFLSEFQKMDWKTELAQLIAEATLGYADFMIEKAERNKSVTIGDKEYTYDENTRRWSDTSGNKYTTLTWDNEKGYQVSGLDKSDWKIADNSGSSGGKNNNSGTRYSAVFAGITLDNDKKGYQSKQEAKNAAIKYLSTQSSAINKQITMYKAGARTVSMTSQEEAEYINGLRDKARIFAAIQKTPHLITTPAFKTGGIADFTGPAWLDGTKSRPEIILNQQDSQNFIMLKDILSGLFSSTSKTPQKSGDNYFEIHIDVDRLDSAYDVDQVAEDVKRKIIESSRYRNNNMVSITR